MVSQAMDSHMWLANLDMDLGHQPISYLPCTHVADQGQAVQTCKQRRYVSTPLRLKQRRYDSRYSVRIHVESGSSSAATTPRNATERAMRDVVSYKLKCVRTCLALRT